MPSDLLHRRPDLIAGEQEILAADARLAQSRADLRPRFPLTGAFGTASTQLRDQIRNPLDGNMMVWNFLANLVQPLYAGGRLRASFQRDEVLVRAAVLRYEGSLLRAYQEVETALTVESLLPKQEAALASSTRQSLAARDVAEARYRRGLTDIVTVLAARRAALNSESSWLTLRRLRLDNRVNLHLALGGGFTGDLPASPNRTPMMEPSQRAEPLKQKEGS